MDENVLGLWLSAHVREDVEDVASIARGGSTQTDTSTCTHAAKEEGGGEVYDEETDTWTKTCSDCGYQLMYEKM